MRTINMKKSAVIHGDNLNVLSNIPTESVDLIYLDPPFFSKREYEVKGLKKEEIIAFRDTINAFRRRRENRLKNVKTKQDIENYLEEHEYVGYLEIRKNINKERSEEQKDDIWCNRTKEGLTEYLAYMRDVIYEIHRILKSTGSMYLHCDWHASHYLKTIADEIFKYNNFRNNIIWHYISAPESKKNFGKKHDDILFYSKSNKSVFDIQRVPHSKNTSIKRVYKHKNKDYVCNTNPDGKAMDDVWDIPIIQCVSKERLKFPTQKPEALLERIIRTSSNRGDIVLDAFCGSGTTAVVAHRLQRKYIAIDITKTAIDFTKNRLAGKLCEYVGITTIKYTKKELSEMHWLTYQNYICDILNAKSNGPGAEKGIDGVGHYIKDDKEYTFMIQVKQAQTDKDKTATDPEIREFIGSLPAYCKVGIFVARGYTKPVEKTVCDANRTKDITIHTLTEDVVTDPNFRVDDLLDGKLRKLYTTQYDDTPPIADYNKW